jgi:hypothetical protein
MIKTAIHAFFRIAFAVILFGAIGAGVSLLFAYQNDPCVDSISESLSSLQELSVSSWPTQRG